MPLIIDEQTIVPHEVKKLGVSHPNSFLATPNKTPMVVRPTYKMIDR